VHCNLKWSLLVSAKFALPRRSSKDNPIPRPAAGGKAVVSPVFALDDGISVGEKIADSEIPRLKGSQIKPE
jgi:hypothetical protein